MHGGKQVVEHLGLQSFIRYPFRTIRKEIQLYRHPFGGRLKLTDHQREILIHLRVCTEVMLQVMTEHVEVHFFLTCCLETLHPFFLAERFQLFRSTETYGVHIDVDGALHPSATAFPHTAPVLEGVVHQGVGRYGRNGLVPILYLDGSECHFEHRTIGPILGHGNPIPRTEHIIGGKLHTRHQPHDGILEHQRKDSCRSSQTGKYLHGVFINQSTDDDNRTHTNHDEFHHLIEALHGALLQLLVLAADDIERSKERTDKAHHHDGDIDPTNLQDKRQRHGFAWESEGNEGSNDDGRHHVTEIVQHPVVEQIVVPLVLRLGGELFHGSDHHLTAKPMRHVGQQEYTRHGDNAVYRSHALGLHTQLLQPHRYCIVDCFHILVFC